SRRRHTRCLSDWSSDVCSSDLIVTACLGKKKMRCAGMKRCMIGTIDRPESIMRIGGFLFAAALGLPTLLCAEEKKPVAAPQKAKIGRASCRARAEKRRGQGSRT